MYMVINASLRNPDQSGIRFSYLEMKSLFKLIVYNLSGFVFLGTSRQPTFKSESWARELSQGKNPREIPFHTEHAEVAPMAASLFSQKKAASD